MGRVTVVGCENVGTNENNTFKKVKFIVQTPKRVVIH